MPTPYEINPLFEGDRFSASQWNDVLTPLMHRSDTPQQGLVDSLGTLQSFSVLQETWRWGKLDEELTAGSQVTVSLWRGTDGDWAGWEEDSNTDWEDVYAPPLMTSGSIAADKWVLIRDFGSRKVIVAHEC